MREEVFQIAKDSGEVFQEESKYVIGFKIRMDNHRLVCVCVVGAFPTSTLYPHPTSSEINYRIHWD